MQSQNDGTNRLRALVEEQLGYNRLINTEEQQTETDRLTKSVEKKLEDIANNAESLKGLAVVDIIHFMEDFLPIVTSYPLDEGQKELKNKICGMVEVLSNISSNTTGTKLYLAKSLVFTNELESIKGDIKDSTDKGQQEFFKLIIGIENDSPFRERDMTNLSENDGACVVGSGFGGY